MSIPSSLQQYHFHVILIWWHSLFNFGPLKKFDVKFQLGNWLYNNLRIFSPSRNKWLQLGNMLEHNQPTRLLLAKLKLKQFRQFKNTRPDLIC